MRFDLSVLSDYAKENEIFLPDTALSMLECYGNLLLEWNEKINLTAITEPSEIVIKHFTDSLSLLRVIDPRPGEKLIDIGTGAGFPGMVLKILRPALSVTLLDGHAKRFLFLDDLSRQLSLPVEMLHDRAELAAKKENYREQFDYATARAVARLQTLSEYCLPFVKPGGCFLAMKGPDFCEEYKEAKKALSLLGAGEITAFSFSLPDGSERNILKANKTSHTPAAYPRASAKIAKQPL